MEAVLLEIRGMNMCGGGDEEDQYITMDEMFEAESNLLRDLKREAASRNIDIVLLYMIMHRTDMYEFDDDSIVAEINRYFKQMDRKDRNAFIDYCQRVVYETNMNQDDRDVVDSRFVWYPDQ